MQEPNILKLSDSYKLTHWKQYPEDTQKVYSYFESRGGMFPEVTFFGLQHIIKTYLTGQVVTQEKIEEAAAFTREHFGSEEHFNRKGWEYILRKYDGRLPLTIKAVPEGTTVGTHNVLMTVENTDVECYWLTNYVETLLVQVWYPTTVATLSRNMKKLIFGYLEKTGDTSLADFKLHDFGFRGVSSVESAGIGGAAHLVNFKGSDTIQGIVVAKESYGCPMAGFSIPAAEHSTITSWGKDREVWAYKNMLDQYPTGLVAVVSDSYDIYNACENLWGGQLRDQVLNRDGVLIIRPDSGNPTEVVVKVAKILAKQFGATKNAKGYLVLDPHVRIIQGDGIDFKSTGEILQALMDAGFSADNVGFGMGGGLLQKLDRDTQKFAFKCSSVTVASKAYDVFKSPITDPGKNSKKGILRLVKSGSKFITVGENDVEPQDDVLQEVFYNGELLNEQTFEEIRERAAVKELVASA